MKHHLVSLRSEREREKMKASDDELIKGEKLHSFFFDAW